MGEVLGMLFVGALGAVAVIAFWRGLLWGMMHLATVGVPHLLVVGAGVVVVLLVMAVFAAMYL